MANKKKLDPAKFAPQPGGRRIGFRPLRLYYLIVCEGEKTEPNYFEGLKKKLPPGMMESTRIDIEGKGYNTLSLVKKAKEKKDELEKNSLRRIDKLWVVFDRDSFKPQDFNAAVAACKSEKGMDAAWSHEAFELWYLLHFAYYDTAISRKQYQEKLGAYVQVHIDKDFKYQKNHIGMYDLLESRKDIAIKHAKRLRKIHAGANYADHGPCTTVYELIEELRDLAKEYT